MKEKTIKEEIPDTISGLEEYIRRLSDQMMSCRDKVQLRRMHYAQNKAIKKIEMFRDGKGY